MLFKKKLSSNRSQHEPQAGLSAFASELETLSPETVGSTDDGPPSVMPRVLKLAAVLVVIALTAMLGTRQYRRYVAGRTATLAIETSVPGQEVLVEGAPKGRTPVNLSLAPGSYVVQVGQGEHRREMKIELAAGASVVRQIDLAPSRSAAEPQPTAVAGSQLRIETDQPAAAVLVDGIDRGPSPATVQGLGAGPHDIVVRAGAATLRRRIVTRSGESTTVVFAATSAPEPTAPPVAGAGGWFTVAAPVPVQIRQAGRVIGSSDVERQMLPTGDHALQFVNEALGYDVRRTVRIEAGKTASVQLERVNGVLSINAQPWAEVWIGGERIGPTPIGNLSRPIGTYEIILRHPELGERRERVTITAKQPTRLGVDLRRK